MLRLTGLLSRGVGAMAVLCMLLAGCAVLIDSDQATGNIGQADNLLITILGSGTPVPSRNQVGSAILIEAGETTILIDCGRGCTSRLAEYNPALVTEIDKLFLTHLHSDHVVGIPDLWLNGWTQGRDTPLQVWGPPGVAGMMNGLRSAYQADFRYRNAGPGRPTPLALQERVTIYEPEADVVFDDGGVKVIAFPVNHANIPAFGFRVEYGERVVMISGDTSISPNLTRFGTGADVVLLEVLSPAMVDYVTTSFSTQRRKAILGLHLTAEQASEVLAQTNPELSVYYHTVASCATDPMLLARTAEFYDGDVVVARDLMQVRISSDGRITTDYLAGDPEHCG